MTDKNLTKDDTKLASNHKSSISDKKETRPTPKTKTGHVGLLSLFLIISLAAAGYFSYLMLEKKINSATRSSEANQLSGNTLLSNHAASEKALNNSISQLSTSHQLLEKTLTTQIELLQDQVKKSRRQWLISEAEHLSSLANNHLYLATNVITAISALEAADQRLKDNGDPLTYPIRKQIALEISLLKQLELPDIIGLSSQLLALESSISQMDIIDPHAGKTQAPAIGKGDSSPVPASIQESFDDAWSNFSKLIVIRHNDQPMAALMTPEQVESIRKNLALKVEAARLALIQKNEKLYSANLALTAKWLEDYFDAENPAVKVAIKQIKVLKNTPISVSLPDISQSLAMLRALPLTPLQQTETKPIAAKIIEDDINIEPKVAAETETIKQSDEATTTDSETEANKQGEQL